MGKRDSEETTRKKEAAGQQPDGLNARKLSDQPPVSHDLPITGRPARFFAWLGNHFFAVTLLLTAILLIWAIGFAGR